MKGLHVLLLAACLSSPLQADALTTRGVHIVNNRGQNVQFKGVQWYGFNIQNYGNFLGDPKKGYDSITKDVRTNIWRMKQLGFNAIRLPFTFEILTAATKVFPSRCTVASKQAVINSVLHPGFPQKIPSTQPPTIPGGICNAGMPTSRPWEQYVWTVGLALRAGMYMQLDFHGNKYGDQSFYLPSYFISSWQKLLRDVVKLPGAKDHIIIDVANEPDGYDCTWDSCKGWGTATNLYTRTWDALYPICRDCLLLAEGSGQAQGWSNYGDGFTTNKQTIDTIKSYLRSRGQAPVYADASRFFQAIHFAKWQRQIVLSPHIYCPGVTGARDHYAGVDLYKRLHWSFGDKQTSGYRYQGVTRTYAVVNGEFGSTLANQQETSCMASIMNYMNNYVPKAYKHPPIKSYFYWVWNADSVDTGGLLELDWRTIAWKRLDMLSKNLSLVPWYKWAPSAKKG